MCRLVVILFVTSLSTTAYAGSSEKIAEVVLSEYINCTTVSTSDTPLLPPKVFKTSDIESFTISDGLVTIQTRIREEETRTKTTYVAVPGGGNFSGSQTQQTIKTDFQVLVRDKVRHVRWATARLNLAWIVTDKKTKKKSMLLGFLGGGEPHPDLLVLSKVLETEFNAATNLVQLWNLTKLPLLIDKSGSFKLAEFSITDSVMTIGFDGPGPLHTLIMVALGGLQKVATVEDKLKGTRNMSALFRKAGQ